MDPSLLLIPIASVIFAIGRLVFLVRARRRQRRGEFAGETEYFYRRHDRPVAWSPRTEHVDSEYVEKDVELE